MSNTITITTSKPKTTNLINATISNLNPSPERAIKIVIEKMNDALKNEANPDSAEAKQIQENRNILINLATHMDPQQLAMFASQLLQNMSIMSFQMHGMTKMLEKALNEMNMKQAKIKALEEHNASLQHIVENADQESRIKSKKLQEETEASLKILKPKKETKFDLAKMMEELWT